MAEEPVVAETPEEKEAPEAVPIVSEEEVVEPNQAPEVKDFTKDIEELKSAMIDVKSVNEKLNERLEAAEKALNKPVLKSIVEKEQPKEEVKKVNPLELVS